MTTCGDDANKFNRLHPTASRVMKMKKNVAFIGTIQQYIPNRHSNKNDDKKLQGGQLERRFQDQGATGVSAGSMAKRIDSFVAGSDSFAWLGVNDSACFTAVQTQRPMSSGGSPSALLRLRLMT